MKPDILINRPVLESIQLALEQSFTCHKLYEASDRTAFLNSVASKIRGLATFNHAPTALIDVLPALEIIANCSVGNDGIDLATAGRRGIVVTNTPDVLNDCVAETAMALALNLLHRYPQAEQWLRQGRWPSGPFQLASELNRRTMGILGFGRIGAAIAQRAVAFGMNVRYHNRQRKETSYEYDASPIELATNSSVLMITVPGGDATRGLVNSAVLDALGPNGYLVNISRGSVIDEPALIAALRNKRIAGAALDVFDNEPNINPAFLELDNVVLTPHVGSASWETRTAMGNLQVENLRRYFSGEAVLTPVR
jgi:lactate dehydrogenase-like 2-hydroxyacid dehydrogenase